MTIETPMQDGDARSQRPLGFPPGSTAIGRHDTPFGGVLARPGHGAHAECFAVRSSSVGLGNGVRLDECPAPDIPLPPVPR